jgi:hypothetical protein
MVVATVQRALQTLTEGLPGRNDPYLTGTGELDNGEVRRCLADAAFTVVLHGEPSKVFDDLAHYFDESEILGWFGNKRAELVLEMLLYQSGWTEYSTWNSLRERELRQLVTRPDRRWMEVCSLIRSEHARLMRLATALGERLLNGPGERP